MGALAWARPDSAAKLLGLPAPVGQSSYLWRLFDIRDVVVGIGTLASADGGRRAWTTFGAMSMRPSRGATNPAMNTTGLNMAGYR